MVPVVPVVPGIPVGPGPVGPEPMAGPVAPAVKVVLRLTARLVTVAAGVMPVPVVPVARAVM